MKEFAVIGAGRFGSSLARTLSQIGHEVIVIDKDEDVINDLADVVTFAAVGDVSDPKVLRALGVANVDTAIIAMSSDFEASILSTIACKELGVKRVIAKAKDETHEKILRAVGADDIVIPEADMGQKLAHNLSSSNVVDLFNLSSDYNILEIKAPSPWVDKSIGDLNIRARYGASVIGILDKDDIFHANPSPDTVIKKGDILIMLGTSEQYGEIEGLDDE